MPLSTVIREDIPAYMADLKGWLKETESQPLEGMAAFFEARLGEYEDHMTPWREAYRQFAAFVPEEARDLLDLGCGTGLELEPLLRARPDLRVTGIDLCSAMLAKCREKFPQVRILCADYLTADLGEAVYDCVLSFQSLHHFRPAVKSRLFEKAYRALKPGGLFLEADYLACCEEEETLLASACEARRRRDGLADETAVHFDIPLTVEHETALLEEAGFAPTETPGSIAGATFLLAHKPK